MSEKIIATFSDIDITANVNDGALAISDNEDIETTAEDEKLCVAFDDKGLRACVKDDSLETNLGSSNIIKIVKSIRSYNDLDDKPRINGVELIGDKTSEEIGCVPFELSKLDEIPNKGRGFRETAYLYINSGNTGYRASLEQIKNLSTKIVDCKNTKDVDYTQLSKGDYVYSEE